MSAANRALSLLAKAKKWQRSKFRFFFLTISCIEVLMALLSTGRNCWLNNIFPTSHSVFEASMIKKLVGLFVFSLGLLVCDAGLLLAQTSITITKVTDGQTGIVSFEGTYVVGAGETLEQVAIIVFDADNMSPGKTQKANVNNGKWDINYKTTAGDYVRAIATIITDANIVEDNKTPGDFTKGATKWVVK